MPSHTIKLKKEQVRVVNVVKSVMDLDSIDQAISFIIEDYAKTKTYAKFIAEKRSGLKKNE
jgi:hypothetical protein